MDEDNLDLQYETGKRAWSSQITMAAQQMSSKLERLVTPDDEPWIGEQKSLDFIRPFELQEGHTVNAHKTHSDPEEYKRWYTRRDFHDYMLLPHRKIQSIVNNPANEYQMNYMAAAKRTMDDVIIDALDAPAREGKHGPEVTTPFPINRIIPHGNTGMTRQKILDALALFKKEDLDDDATDLGLTLSMVWTHDEEHQLLEDPKITSSDYVSHQFLMEGGISPTEKVLGVNYLRTNRLKRTDDENGIRRCYMFRRDAVKKSDPQPITPIFRIAQERVRHPLEIGVEMDVAAGRTLDELVVVIEVDTNA